MKGNLMNKIKGAIFDLDGVLVDTAQYHYLAWRRLAQELGFSFTPEQNESLKGVSRMKSLDILLHTGGMKISDTGKVLLAEKKNKWYVEYLETLTEKDVLFHVEETLLQMRSLGIKTAIGSASKNTPLILQKTDLAKYFDTVVDGNDVSQAKPNPEVFLLGARRLQLLPGECLVFEDSAAGIEAANTAGMLSVYLGQPRSCISAALTIKDLSEFDIHDFITAAN